MLFVVGLQKKRISIQIYKASILSEWLKSSILDNFDVFSMYPAFLAVPSGQSDLNLEQITKF